MMKSSFFRFSWIRSPADTQLPPPPGSRRSTESEVCFNHVYRATHLLGWIIIGRARSLMFFILSFLSSPIQFHLNQICFPFQQRMKRNRSPKCLQRLLGSPELQIHSNLWTKVSNLNLITKIARSQSSSNIFAWDLILRVAMML